MKRDHLSRSRLRRPRLGAASRHALLWTVALALLHPPAAVAALDRLSRLDLALGSIELVSVRFLGETTEVTLRASVANLDTGTFQLSALLQDPPTGVEIVDGRLDFPQLGPSGAVRSTDTATIRFPNALTVEAESWASAADSWDLGGVELTVLNPRYKPIDFPTDHALDYFLPNIWVFSGSTPLLDSLVPGDVLITHGSPPLGYQPEVIPPTAFPKEVVGVTLVGDEVHVEVVAPAIEPTLGDIYQSGLVGNDGACPGPHFGRETDLEDPSLAGCEDEGSGASYTGRYFELNDIEIAPNLFLSGALGLGQMDFGIRIKIRSGEPAALLLSYGFQEALTLELRAEADIDLVPAVEIPLGSPITVPIGAVQVGAFPLIITLQIEPLLGVEAQLQAGATTSIVQETTVDNVMTVDLRSDTPLFEPVPAPSTLSFTPPQLDTDTGANARFFTALDTSVFLDGIIGPTVRAEAYAQLEVAPGTPWWTLSTGVALQAGLTVQLLGVEVAQQLFPVVDLVLGSIDSESFDNATSTALASERGLGGSAPTTSGDAVRWARSIDLEISGAPNAYTVIGTSDGGAIATAGNISRGFVVKLSPTGEVEWSRSLPFLQRLIGVAELPTGGYLLAGSKGLSLGPLFLGVLDSNGALGWRQEYDLEGAVRVRDVAFVANPDGTMDGFLAGNHRLGTEPGRTFALRFHYDPAGTPSPVTFEWAKAFEDTAGAEEIFAVAPLAGGGVALVGQSRVPLSLLGTSGGGSGTILGIGADGSQLWGWLMGTWRWEGFRAVAAGPLGKLFGVGGSVNHIWDEHHAFWGRRFDADGVLHGQLTYAEEGDCVLPPCAVVDSAWDEALDVTATGDGFVAVGKLGLNSETAWILRLDELGSVVWMQTIDGPSSDQLVSVDDTGDGLVALGVSRSFEPLGVGGSPTLWVLKLGYDGNLDFLPATLTTTRFTRPHLVPWPCTDPLGDCNFHPPATSGTFAATEAYSVTATDVVVTALGSSVTATDLGLVSVELVRPAQP